MRLAAPAAGRVRRSFRGLRSIERMAPAFSATTGASVGCILDVRRAGITPGPLISRLAQSPGALISGLPGRTADSERRLAGFPAPSFRTRLPHARPQRAAYPKGPAASGTTGRQPFVPTIRSDDRERRRAGSFVAHAPVVVLAIRGGGPSAPASPRVICSFPAWGSARDVQPAAQVFGREHARDEADPEQ